jgi:hypothetical protein
MYAAAKNTIERAHQQPTRKKKIVFLYLATHAQILPVVRSAFSSNHPNQIPRARAIMVI